MKKIVHYLVAFLFVSMFLFSCKKEVALSAMEKAIIDATARCGASSYSCEPYISQYVWREKIVYASLSGGAYCCFSIPVYYDFDGAVLLMENGYTFEDFLAESHYVANYWACK